MLASDSSYFEARFINLQVGWYCADGIVLIPADRQEKNHPIHEKILTGRFLTRKEPDG